MLSLNEAIRSDRLGEFIAQEEARGAGPVDHAALAAPQSEGQTSRSASDDGSSGKKTRRGKSPPTD